MLTLYRPKLSDLWFRQALLADEETMSYNRAWGGTIAFPEEDWADSGSAKISRIAPGISLF